MEKTLLIIKPDGVKRKLIGEVIRRVENKNLNILDLKMEKISLEKAEKHYEIHRGKEFYGKLIEFITSGPVILMIIEGEKVIEIVRKMAGETKPEKSELGSIRGDYSVDILENIVHTSDSFDSAKKEINNFF